MRCSGLTRLLCSVIALVALNHPALAEPVPAAHIFLGQSIAPLNGPWRFHVGDDLRWSLPDFDDNTWETVDLTAAPGAHDGDVGLPGYVAGWSMRGHAKYTGYAWYRMKIIVASNPNTPLALAGPTLVDSSYQLYIDGRLLGSSGIFSGRTPTVFGVRPSLFPLPFTSATSAQTHTIALRVWMDPIDAGEDSGGIHIAPTIGSADGIDLLHQVQWLQTFKGYVVDAIEPFAFVLLALMVFGLMACRTGDAYGWLLTALLVLAVLRIHQILFYWTHSLSLRCYDIATVVILRPAALAAWTLAWRDWFRLNRAPSLPYVLGALTMVYAICACMGRPWFEAGQGVKTFADIVVEGMRLTYVVLYLGIVGLGVLRSDKLFASLSMVAAILVGMGLFAPELSAIGMPGIWFPDGTGVSRTQYAYAAFIALLFLLILMRSIGYARRP